MIQDVVYNHLGPSGNYLPEFFPIFAEGGANTWGNSINLSGPDSDEVRRYIIDNALMWLRDMHVDGLRLDAVHALVDERATHVLEEMAQEVDKLSVAVGRPLTPDRRERPQRPAHGHPAGRRRHGADRAVERRLPPRPARDADRRGAGLLLRLRRRGSSAAWPRPSPARSSTTAPGRASAVGTTAGRSTPRRCPGWKFLGYLQDHDQIGNRAVGDRISASLSPGLLAVGATLVLTSPFTPMLFMGEEWGASTPWQFFTSHPEPELGKATAEGRIGEFAEHGWDADVVPDPQDPETFTRSKLDWSELVARSRTSGCSPSTGRCWRCAGPTPTCVDPDLAAVHVDWDDADRWLVVHRGTLRVVVNLADQPREIDLDRPATDVLFATGELPDARRHDRDPARRRARPC